MVNSHISAAKIAEGLQAKQTGPGKWLACCPAHDDKNPSLSISEGLDGKPLVHCHAGCSQEAVIQELKNRGLWGKSAHETAPDRIPKRRFGTKPVNPKTFKSLDDEADEVMNMLRRKELHDYIKAGRYLYHDQAGNVVACMLRYEWADGSAASGGKPEKTFRPVHVADGGWRMGDLPGIWPLYGLAKITAGADTVVIVEGEKAANAAAEMLLASTTSAHGSQSPGKTDWSPVSGRDVVILPDNDEAGRKYARCVADLTHKAGAKGVKIVELPALPDKGDIVEWIEARPGKQPEENRSELEELVRQTEPWRPPSGDGRGLDPIDAAKTGNAYAQTDLGNAERLVALHGHEIRWDTALKAWRVWDGRRWAVDSSLKLNTMAAETVRSIRREAARRLDCSIRAVDHWARMGILKKVKISGRKRAVGFRETDITALIENNQ